LILDIFPVNQLHDRVIELENQSYHHPIFDEIFINHPEKIQQDHLSIHPFGIAQKIVRMALFHGVFSSYQTQEAFVQQFDAQQRGQK
jgi:hypothetical protein